MIPARKEKEREYEAEAKMVPYAGLPVLWDAGIAG